MTVPLRVADLGTGGNWIDIDVNANLEEAYRAVTGWLGPEIPIGLASVVGRLAYTRGRIMPPGGVLREISQTTYSPLPADGPWQARVCSAVLGERTGRRLVEITTDLRRDGAPVASVRFLLDWPVGAP
jgi:hypothetical protein